jgi:hypothetical protein
MAAIVASSEFQKLELQEVLLLIGATRNTDGPIHAPCDTWTTQTENQAVGTWVIEKGSEWYRTSQLLRLASGRNVGKAQAYNTNTGNITTQLAVHY